MAKGQKKSNKEIKKPKQDKAKPAPASGLTAQLMAADKAKKK